VEDAKGKPIDAIYRACDIVTREQKMNPVTEILTGNPIPQNGSHAVLSSKDGIERTISTMGAPIRDKESRLIGSVLVLRDITEQLRTEQELGKIRKLESVGVLAGGIAHDFNNILSAIIGNIDLSIQNTDITSESRILLTEAHKASIRAQTLTRQLLTFARGGEPVKETASLAVVIMESANFILRGKKVACSYSLPDDLYLVDIDKGQFSQVIQNMILNADQAMSGSGTVKVTCENIPEYLADKHGLPGSSAYVKIDVADTGVGIPVQMMDRIFDPYFTTKQQGSGLGLAISHSIVTKHGGYIKVKSSPGEGTVFSIFLPASLKKTISSEIKAESNEAKHKKEIGRAYV
jgi:signal transduction histidine kinase